ncbi:carbohydrate sulfotransferase 6-like [Labrus mixtus]|uniref:carbohydrate sulfotransferase 6-like n=1 Tax=Labrus mixtus TaxID=508554 RepID=UPI0029C044F1|nr:carbohydrate sulfotransferase 6-like [Labrus mixtus]
MPIFRVNLNTLILLSFLQGAMLLLFCSWYMGQSPFSPVSVNNTAKVHVLLLSTYRSGSSFMGEVFNQHPSVFHFMEPAWHVWNSLQKHGAQVLRMAVRDFLRSIFQCDFSVMDAYLPNSQRVSDFYLWRRSRALCSPPVCSLTPRNQMSNESQCSKVCGGHDLQLVQEACGTYSHVVFKEVRIFELESLYPLFQDPSLDLRIIHLVRDPRAVLRSREHVSGNLATDSAIILEQRHIPAAEVQFQVMQEVCRSHVRIIERATLEPPPFLKGRYKMVRYEDIARNPLKEINAVYEFVGLKMTTELAKWIYSLTHGIQTDKLPFNVGSRNAYKISEAWREVLSHNRVKQIQELCQEAMSLLGYRPVNSEEEQKSLDKDLLMPLEQYNPGTI